MAVETHSAAIASHNTLDHIKGLQEERNTRPVTLPLHDERPLPGNAVFLQRDSFDDEGFLDPMSARRASAVVENWQRAACQGVRVRQASLARTMSKMTRAKEPNFAERRRSTIVIPRNQLTASPTEQEEINEDDNEEMAPLREHQETVLLSVECGEEMVPGESILSSATPRQERYSPRQTTHHFPRSPPSPRRVMVVPSPARRAVVRFDYGNERDDDEIYEGMM